MSRPPPLTDHDVHRHLARIANELRQLAEASGSLVGETALRTAAQTVDGMAKVVRDHAGPEPH
ncbi:hypothetical protein [Phenylobacterium sp.]|jgi:hypothetical protein|uniref:hypothetical protein n=1 Tax=Phenylobacterium sp. TaxID=1871053 RepID=UPI003783EE87